MAGATHDFPHDTTVFPGARRHPLYCTWRSMLHRCANPAHSNYKQYGARGVAVCSAWFDFARFIADIGPRPAAGWTLERVDNNRGYERANCRWATRGEQALNRRGMVMVLYRGQRMSLAQAWKLAGSTVPYGTVLVRVRKLRWPLTEALTRPSSPHRRRPDALAVPSTQVHEAWER